jgi:hypothetical protein
VPAVKESVANRARIGSIEEGFGRWPISVADIEATIGNAKKAIARLEGKKRVRVTSPAGTDVVVSIERRPALEVVPIPRGVARELSASKYQEEFAEEYWQDWVRMLDSSP